MSKTTYRLIAMEHEKRRILLDSLRKEMKPYTINYDPVQCEYVIEVEEKPVITKEGK